MSYLWLKHFNGTTLPKVQGVILKYGAFPVTSAVLHPLTAVLHSALQ